MIIYNKTWLSNLLMIEQVEEKFHRGFLTADELKNIKRSYPVGFYTPGFFARVGMFLLTVVISVFSCGLLSLIFSEFSMTISYGWFFFLGLAHYVALEMIVQTNFYYRAGVDDALLWISAGLTGGSFFLSVENIAGKDLLSAAFLFILSLALTIRFADIVMSLVMYLSALAFVFFAWQETGAFGLATMPFVMMLFSGLSFWQIKRHLNSVSTYFYPGCMRLLQIIALITLYISGNYYVVKELGDMLHGTVSDTIPLAWFFWLWTIFMPIVYVGSGLRKKDRILLRIGLLLIILAAATFRNYYHVMPLELAMILAGVFGLVLAWISINYLKQPKKGITAQEMKSLRPLDVINVESLVIAETFSDTAESADEKGTRFGGGSFGGGGASGGY